MSEEKKKKFEWKNSYSNYTQIDAEKRIKHSFISIFNNADDITNIINIERFKEKTKNIKEDVYKKIVQCISIEDYPLSIEPFKEENMTDLSFLILLSTIADFKEIENAETIKLRREKKIIAIDKETGVSEQFVIVNAIDISEEKYIMIIENKNASLAECFKQCILALKDSYDSNNDKKTVYGFLTTGVFWQLVTYNENEIKMSDDIKVAFPRIKMNKQKWIDNYSIIIDIIYTILYNYVKD